MRRINPSKKGSSLWLKNDARLSSTSMRSRDRSTTAVFPSSVQLLKCHSSFSDDHCPTHLKLVRYPENFLYDISIVIWPFWLRPCIFYKDQRVRPALPRSDVVIDQHLPPGSVALPLTASRRPRTWNDKRIYGNQQVRTHLLARMNELIALISKLINN